MLIDPVRNGSDLNVSDVLLFQDLHSKSRIASIYFPFVVQVCNQLNKYMEAHERKLQSLKVVFFGMSHRPALSHCSSVLCLRQRELDVKIAAKERIVAEVSSASEEPQKPVSDEQQSRKSGAYLLAFDHLVCQVPVVSYVMISEKDRASRTSTMQRQDMERYERLNAILRHANDEVEKAQAEVKREQDRVRREERKLFGSCLLRRQEKGKTESLSSHVNACFMNLQAHFEQHG